MLQVAQRAGPCTATQRNHRRALVTVQAGCEHDQETNRKLDRARIPGTSRRCACALISISGMIYFLLSSRMVIPLGGYRTGRRPSLRNRIDVHLCGWLFLLCMFHWGVLVVFTASEGASLASFHFGGMQVIMRYGGGRVGLMALGCFSNSKWRYIFTIYMHSFCTLCPGAPFTGSQFIITSAISSGRELIHNIYVRYRQRADVANSHPVSAYWAWPEGPQRPRLRPLLL